jgi:hypothetical protein
MKLFNFIVFCSILWCSFGCLADCPDAKAVMCQNTKNPQDRRSLETSQFGTCWNWSSFSCGFCSAGKQEKDAECRKKFGDSFEARMPMAAP